jgi:hypothetical protein
MAATLEELQAELNEIDDAMPRLQRLWQGAGNAMDAGRKRQGEIAEEMAALRDGEVYAEPTFADSVIAVEATLGKPLTEITIEVLPMEAKPL